jgi:hypothetical protein
MKIKILTITFLLISMGFIPAIQSDNIKIVEDQTDIEYEQMQRVPDEFFEQDPPEDPEPGTEETIEGEKGNCAIVIRADNIFAFPILQSLVYCMFLSARHVKRTMLNNSYNVKFLVGPLNLQIKNAITNWVPENIGGEKKLFIYIIGHGTNFLGGVIIMRTGLFLLASMLGNWLDKIKDEYSQCTVLIESCEGGAFVDELSGDNRIIITSTSDSQPSYGNRTDESPYTKVFFNELDKGTTIGEAWEIADRFVVEEGLEKQDPQIDDNGNGLSVGNLQIIDTLPITDSQGLEDGNIALDATLTDEPEDDDDNEDNDSESSYCTNQLMLRFLAKFRILSFLAKFLI